jgi:hypothetical protein
VVAAAFAALVYGCWLVYPPLGFIVPSLLILTPRLLQRLRSAPREVQVPRGRKPWAA